MKRIQHTTRNGDIVNIYIPDYMEEKDIAITEISNTVKLSEREKVLEIAKRMKGIPPVPSGPENVIEVEEFSLFRRKTKMKG